MHNQRKQLRNPLPNTVSVMKQNTWQNHSSHRILFMHTFSSLVTHFHPPPLCRHFVYKQESLLGGPDCDSNPDADCKAKASQTVTRRIRLLHLSCDCLLSEEWLGFWVLNKGREAIKFGAMKNINCSHLSSWTFHSPGHFTRSKRERMKSLLNRINDSSDCIPFCISTSSIFSHHAWHLFLVQ